MKSLPVSSTHPTPESEARSLAYELAKARNELIQHYRRQCKLGPREAVARVDEADCRATAEAVLSSPLRDTTWAGLEYIAAVDPELAVRRWEEVKEAAREELAGGHRAAACLESADSACWKRAQFLALRESLAGQWRPAIGVEWSLIDVMVQALTLQMHWTQRLVELDALESSEEDGTLKPPRLNMADAIEQAAGMADRFHRMFIRALRQLRDLRRYTVVIQAVDQVNIGQNQLNVAGAGEPEAGGG
jgi:hypothetical protein